jgi:hypothetical protein
MPIVSTGTVEITVYYDSGPVSFKSNPQSTAIHYPLQSGIRHPGGRLQRKARLRKKQQKYRFKAGYSFKGLGAISDTKIENMGGELLKTMTWTMIDAKAFDEKYF